MKITILGYNSPFPGTGQAGPGFLLEHNDKFYLIDIGSGVLSRLQSFINLNQLEAVFLSHLHHDHMSDFLVLQYAVQMQFLHKGRTKALPVYFPNEPKNIAEIIPFQNFIEPHFINDDTTVDLAGLKVSFLKTDHSIPCYAMKFETKDKIFIYGADSGIETRWLPFANQADLLILECTYLEEDRPAKPLGHLSTKDVVEISNSIGAKNLLLTHFYPEYDEAEIIREVEGFGLKARLYKPEYGKAVII